MARGYFIASGTIFGGVAVLHLLRLLNHWSFQVGPLVLPLWASWGGLVFAAALCLWAFGLARRG